MTVQSTTIADAEVRLEPLDKGWVMPMWRQMLANSYYRASDASDSTAMRRYEYAHGMTNTTSLHPVVSKLMFEVTRPIDWHKVMLEWPRVSSTDPDRLAYTRTERAWAEDGPATVTSVNKYIRANWNAVEVPDHMIARLVSEWLANRDGRCMWLPRDAAAYVNAVLTGPASCMKWGMPDRRSYDSDEEHKAAVDLMKRNHPYNCYDPRLGWRMAVRLNADGKIAGRALAFEDENDKEDNHFVRTFRAQNDDPDNRDGYSHADEKLDAWMRAQGFKKRDGWYDGTMLMALTRGTRDRPKSSTTIAPYVDGDLQYGYKSTHEIDGVHQNVWVLSEDDQDYEFTNTDGSASDHEDDDNYTSCDHCDDSYDADDGTTAHDSEGSEITICPHCARNNFTRLRDFGTRSSYVRVPDDSVEQTVDGQDIHPEFCGDYVRVDRGQHVDEWIHPESVDYILDTDSQVWTSDDLNDGDIVRFCSGSVSAGDVVEMRGSDAVSLVGDNAHVPDYYDSDLDVDAGIIVRLTAGQHEGGYVLVADAVTDAAGDVWHVDDIDAGYIEQVGQDDHGDAIYATTGVEVKPAPIVPVVRPAPAPVEESAGVYFRGYKGTNDAQVSVAKVYTLSHIMRRLWKIDRESFDWIMNNLDLKGWGDDRRGIIGDNLLEHNMTIDDAFRWSDTPQGHPHWSQLHDRTRYDDVSLTGVPTKVYVYTREEVAVPAQSVEVAAPMPSTIDSTSYRTVQLSDTMRRLIVVDMQAFMWICNNYDYRQAGDETSIGHRAFVTGMDIGGMFYWFDMPQGHDYWETISRAVMALNPADYAHTPTEWSIPTTPRMEVAAPVSVQV